MDPVLKALIKLLTRRIREAFLASMQDITDKVIIAQLVEQIRAQNVQAAFETLGLSPAAMRPISKMIEEAYEKGGTYAVDQFPSYVETPAGKAVPRFDIRQTRAENWIRDRSSTLIEGVIGNAATNVRTVLTDGMERGENPNRTAYEIVGRIDPVTGQRKGGIIGLTENQEGWVRSARAKLETLDPGYLDMELRAKGSDEIVERAIASGKPLSRDTIDKLIMSYRNNALKYRGRVVARTETLQSINASDYEATQQMIDQGALTASAVAFEWDTAGDTRVRHSHHLMEGQRRQFGEPFVAPSGARLRYPGDTSLGAPASEVVQCRCRLRKRIDWLADLD